MRELYNKYAEHLGAIYMDAISAFLLCFASSLVVLPLFSQDVLRSECIWYCLVAVAFCVAISTNKLTIPILIAIPVLLIGIFTVWQLKTGGAVDYIAGFFNWCLGGIEPTVPYSYDFSIHIVRFLIVLILAAVIYLFFRKLYALLPLVIFSAGCIVYAQLNELEPRYEIISLLIIVNLTAIAHTTHRSIKKKLGEKAMMPAAVMRFSAFILSSIIVFLSVNIAATDDGKWKSKTMHQFISDMSDLVDYYVYSGGDSSGYDIGWSGYYPMGDRLGGDVNPDNKVVIRAKTDLPALIAGSVYNEYNGQKWSDYGTLGSFRLNSFFWRSIRREAFALTNPRGNKKAKQLFDEITSTVEIEISPDRLYRNIFTAGLTKSIEFKPYNKEVYFNKQGEVYMSQKLSYGVTYVLKTTIPNIKAVDFEEKLYELELLTKSVRDPLYKKMSASYKRLPETLPESIYNYAAEITKDALTPAQKAFAINKWLQNNCTYTLTPGDVPEDRDFVDYFLETKEGYCTYYASAMTVLARCAGLPARYVTGFGLKQNPNRSSTYNYLATNQTAHAWAEIYLSGIGWIPFDATQFNFYELALVPNEVKPEAPNDNNTAPDPNQGSSEEEFVPTEPIPDFEDLPLKPGRKAINYIWVWFYIVIFILITIVVAIIIRVRYVSVGPYRLHRRIKRRYKTKSAQASAVFALISDQLGFISIFLLPGETLSLLRKRVGKLLEQERLANMAFGTIDRLNYGMIEPSDEEIFDLCQLSVYIENTVRKQLGRRTYFFKRVIFSYNPHRVKD